MAMRMRMLLKLNIISQISKYLKRFCVRLQHLTLTLTSLVILRGVFSMSFWRKILGYIYWRAVHNAKNGISLLLHCYLRISAACKFKSYPIISLDKKNLRTSKPNVECGQFSITLNSYFPIFHLTPSLAGHFFLMKQQHRWHKDDETEKLEMFGVKENTELP